MTKPAYWLFLAAMLLVALVPAGAEARERSVSLTAGPKAKTWVSPERFGDDALLITGVYVGGKLIEAPASEGCRLGWVGRGVAARSVTCGGGPIRLRYVSLGAKKRIRFTYEQIY